ncbi:MAG: type II toxin-antitoxin system VapC family toxin [Actinomycetota bacterium]
MIIYLDSSVLARAYLPDEAGHAEALALLATTDAVVITGSWTIIEVSGALLRAARAARGDEALLLAALDADLDARSGVVVTIDAHQAEVERKALELVRSSGIRSMDAWHLACAMLAFDELAEPGEIRVFATHDAEQLAVATHLGWRTSLDS